MKIAIIGTGNVGQALATSFKRSGHEVRLGARDAAKTREVAGKLGVTAAASTSEAVADADAIVLAVPYTAVGDVAREMGGKAAGKLVIDATNPLKPDYSGLATEGGPSGAETVASLLPGAIVVKAFNTLFASIQGNPTVHGTTIDALYATDDEAAKSKAAELLEAMGFRPVHVGGLARAKELEALAWLNIQMQMSHGGAWNTAFVLVSPPQAAVQPTAK